MSWLRRTGSRDLTPPHLDMDIQYTHQMWCRHLIAPGTSSPRTALISTSLSRRLVPGPDEALLAGIRTGLAAHGDPVRARQQQRYMKSRLPYHGLPNPLVALVCRELFSVHRIDDPAAWEATALALWDEATHREEWYAAIALLRHRPYRAYAQSPALLPTLRHLITTGAWWDVVDDIAAHLVGDLLRANPGDVAAVMRAWADSDDLWLRRAAIICQLRSNDATDTDLLADAIAVNLTQTGFFLRKAIGWALRDYARTDPDWVREYVATNAAALSPLSRREALRHLPPASV